MIFHPLEIHGAFLIEPQRVEDRRGFFARTYCRNELEERGLEPTVVQCNVSVNKYKGTVRGMHWQAAPHEEVKLVRCTNGAIYDVLLDVREGSPTYKKWVAIELTRENRFSLYIPGGVAHGFQSLEDDSEVFYQMSEFYHPDLARGVRYNDPAFGIRWKLPVAVVSERDRGFADFADSADSAGSAG